MALSKKRICIVACTIEGLTVSNGTGVAVRALALELAQAGFAVDILFCEPVSGADEVLFPLLQIDFLKIGIRLLPLKTGAEGNTSNIAQMRAVSRSVLKFLCTRDYSIVHFTDSRGLAFYSTIAKSRAQGLQQTLLCMTLHAPLAWLQQFSTLKGSESGISRSAIKLEQQALELADVVIGISNASLNLLNQFKIQPCGQIILVPPPRLDYQIKPTIRKTNSAKEVIFFGRLEDRKGLVEFCQAVELLKQNPANKDIKITFLGANGMVGNLRASKYIILCSRRWKKSITLLTKLDRHSALRYLQKSNILVVLASQSETYGYTLRECLDLGVPFICSDIPAFREQVPKGLAARVIYGRTEREMADFMQAQIGKQAPTPVPPLFKKKQNSWARWHRKQSALVPSHKGQRQQARKASPAKPAALLPISVLPPDGVVAWQPLRVRGNTLTFRKKIGRDQWAVFRPQPRRPVTLSFDIDGEMTEILLDVAAERSGEARIFENAAGSASCKSIPRKFRVVNGRSLYRLKLATNSKNPRKVFVEFNQNIGNVGVHRVWGKKEIRPYLQGFGGQAERHGVKYVPAANALISMGFADFKTRMIPKKSLLLVCFLVLVADFCGAIPFAFGLPLSFGFFFTLFPALFS